MFNADNELHRYTLTHKRHARIQHCGVIIKDEYHHDCLVHEVLLPSSNKTTSVKYARYAYVCVYYACIFFPQRVCLRARVRARVQKTRLRGLDSWGKWIMFDRLAVLKPSIHTC